jgi:hypothetical protein
MALSNSQSVYREKPMNQHTQTHHVGALLALLLCLTNTGCGELGDDEAITIRLVSFSFIPPGSELRIDVQGAGESILIMDTRDSDSDQYTVTLSDIPAGSRRINVQITYNADVLYQGHGTVDVGHRNTTQSSISLAPVGSFHEDVRQIRDVLSDRWQRGYMTENIDLYMSAYWEEGFRYESDMGTDYDPTDDLVFDDIDLERDAAVRVFGQFQDIEWELSDPPSARPLNAEKTRYEIRNHYRIQLFVTRGTLEGGYTGAFAEGDSVLIFEKRKTRPALQEEWRIVEWRDLAFTEREIRDANSLSVYSAPKSHMASSKSLGQMKASPSN